MKSLAYYWILPVFFVVCLFSNSRAEANHFFQRPQADSTPARIFNKIQVIIKDIEDGAPLDSVYITIGTQKGYTNGKGIAEFENVPATSGATFSKSGYYAQSKKPNDVIHVRLARRESRAVISTISTGLYERPTEHFSGAATVVSGNDLRKVNALSFAEALSYYDPSFRVSKNNNNGDNPNVTPLVNIRGAYNFPADATIATGTGINPRGVQISPSVADFIASQIGSPNQPVILLNGIQSSLQVALDIDFNRIEKVTILKDAAATAIYGVRGGNGVVLIQTIKPRKGDINLTYSGQVQITTPDLSSYHLLNASEKFQLEQGAGFYTANPGLLQFRTDQVKKGVNTDWLRQPLNKAGVGSRHSLTLDGGNDDMSYGLNFSYNNVQGVMKGSERKNLNFGAYFGTRFKNFIVDNYLSYSKADMTNSPFGNFSDYAKQNPYWDPIDPVTGKYARLLEVQANGGLLFYNPAYNGILSTTDKANYSRLGNATTLTWIIGNGFKLNGQFSFYKQNDQQDVFLPPGHTFYANFVPSDFFKRGQYNQTLSEFSSLDGGVKLDYNRRVGLHQFYASAGASAMETRSSAVGIVVSGFTSDRLSDLAFGSAYSNKRPTTGKIITRLISGFGNFTYSYNNRYQAEVSINADASSQFSANARLAPHWAGGVSWNLHQERFFHANKILDQFRLRASLGTTGNQYFQSYLGKTSFNYYTNQQYVPGGSNPGTRGIGLGAFMTGFANENLKAPETMKQNIGLDVVLFQNRLSVRFDAYKQKTTDIVLPISSPSSTGFLYYSYYDNLGGIENKGIEFSVSYSIIRNLKKSIAWTISLNGIHDEDRITSTSNYIDALNATNDAITTDQTRPQPRYIAGQSLTAIWAVRSLGIDPSTGMEKFQKADGSSTFIWNAADKKVAGDWSPKWQGSFGTTLSIKNISAGLYFNYQFGAKYYNQTLADKVENADMNYNVGSRATYFRWLRPGDNALFKSVSLNGLLSSPTYATTRFVRDNDFINCSAISLGYTLPQRITSKIRAQGAKLGFIANNVFHSSGMKAEEGIYYPFHHLYSFSITTTF